MRILNWNLLSGGGARSGRIVERIRHHAPDLCILTEHRGGTRSRISEELASLGYTAAFNEHSTANQNSVAAFSRFPVERCEADLGIPAAIRSHLIAFRTNGIGVIGAFCATPEIGRAFLGFIEDLPDDQPEESWLIVGDLYFGARASNIAFRAPLQRLEAMGWRDLWRLTHGAELAWSFQSERGRSQPDHLFAKGPLTAMPVTVEFSMDDLADGLSDHAPMIATF